VAEAEQTWGVGVGCWGAGWVADSRWVMCCRIGTSSRERQGGLGQNRIPGLATPDRSHKREVQLLSLQV